MRRLAKRGAGAYNHRNSELERRSDARSTMDLEVMEELAMAMTGGWIRAVVLATLLAGEVAGRGLAGAAEIDLTRAVVVVPDGLSGPEEKAVRLLVDDVRSRSGVAWNVLIRWPGADVPVIVVGPARLAGSLGDHYAQLFLDPKSAVGKEGFRIRTVLGDGKAPVTLSVIGDDSRGVLFGVGRLLRELRTTAGRVTVPDKLEMASAPKYPLRGHQLGYRPKTNSYDAWDLAQWERYIRDLAIFGTNAIELIPPRSDDDADSPHFPMPPMEMMVGMSKICDDYGIDVWIWYPAMDQDYSDPKTVEFALNEWAEVYRKLPRIDAVFVPGGDPGHTRPKYLMPLLEKQTASLHRYHPNAQMWVSPQSFTKEWYDEFVSIMKSEPAWLTGVVFGPQVRVPLPELRKAVPAKYPIRDYPDITHSLRCQYMVPNWDVAFALTEAREVINPRPKDESAIFHAFSDQTIGFITYSEGCNDDVNKVIWSALGWDPGVDLMDTLREFGRALVGLEGRGADDFAHALFGLEQNWRGALIANTGVETTLAQFAALERAVAPRVLANWRFQQALYRANYDGFVRGRLIHETDLEERALDRLREARGLGSIAAVAAAHSILERAVTQPVATDLRARVFELAEALFQSIHMQLSVPKYKAIDIGRGANLDSIDRALNNREWLEGRFEAIRKLETEAARLKEIDAIVNWTNPGPGGFYDDMGNPLARPHLVPGLPYAKDPALFHGPITAFDLNPALRRSWFRHAGTIFGEPLRMHYDGLDKAAAYKLRVIYGPDMFLVKIGLTANGTVEIHPPLLRPRDMSPLEFELPHDLTRTGTLDLSWLAEPERGGNGRGCQVSEVWLIKR
jgi:hypothetical protein